jgi:hypothetical protein
MGFINQLISRGPHIVVPFWEAACKSKKCAVRFEYDWAREPFKIKLQRFMSPRSDRQIAGGSRGANPNYQTNLMGTKCQLRWGSHEAWAGPAVASHTYPILWHIDDLQNNHFPIGSGDDICSIFMHFPLLITLVVASVSRTYHVPDACDQLWSLVQMI